MESPVNSENVAVGVGAGAVALGLEQHCHTGSLVHGDGAGLPNAPVGRVAETHQRSGYFTHGPSRESATATPT